MSYPGNNHRWQTKPGRDPSIILGLALNPPGEDECVPYYNFRGNEILWTTFIISLIIHLVAYFFVTEMIPSKSSVKQCTWKQEDFSIKLNLAKGEGDSHENVQLKYGRWCKRWKDVENEFPPVILRNRSAYKIKVTWSCVFQSIIFLKTDGSLNALLTSEAGVLAVLTSNVQTPDRLSLALGTP